MPAVNGTVKPYIPAPAPALEGSTRTYAYSEFQKLRQTLDSIQALLKEIKDTLEPL
jgi:hypothetical protein